MEKLSNLISKKLFSFSEGCFVGVILNVAFDEKFNATSLIVADDENDREHSVAYDKIVISDDSVFIASTSGLLPVDGQYERIIGKSVFTNKGVFCGQVKDVYLSRKSAIEIVTDRMSFSPSHISVRGDVIIIGKVSMRPAEALFAPQKQQQQVFAMLESEAKEETAVPYRVSTDPRSLIGKMATKDIFGLNNEILLKKYEIITQKKLLEIKKHNKLNILFYNCK